MPDQQAHVLLLQAYTQILQAYELMGYNIREDDNFAETAARAARAAQELVRPVSEIQAEIDDLLQKTFPARYSEMVISKLSRLIHLMARRPILQEDLTHELAELLFSRLKSTGAAVYIEGLHMCMAARGVEAHEARLVTSAVRGAFADQLPTRQEFLNLVTAAPLQLL